MTELFPDAVPPAVRSQPAQLAHLEQSLASIAGKPYAVVHMYPRYAYKMWHAEGWIAVLAFLHARGYAVVLTGGPAAAEVAYARTIRERAGIETVDVVGKLSLAATAEVIRRARLFLGPDTSASHIAAATGTPTLALFGPSNPVRWGPWPKGWTGSSPWITSGSGRRGNVYLLQGAGACVPCTLEGCEGHVDSWSDCLLTLDATRVIDAATELLGIAPRITPDQRRRFPIATQPFAGARLEMTNAGGRPGQANSDPSLEITL